MALIFIDIFRTKVTDAFIFNIQSSYKKANELDNLITLINSRQSFGRNYITIYSL